MSTFTSANVTDGNLVLKERTHRIKIKYSKHQYSIRLHNLGNWLMVTLLIHSRQHTHFTVSAFKLPRGHTLCQEIMLY